MEIMKCLPYLEQRCQSCQYLNGEYQQSIDAKEQEFLKFFPQTQSVFKSTYQVKNPAGSRNKAKLSVALIENEMQFGIYDRFQNFKKLEDCPLHMEGINSLLIVIKSLLSKFSITPYNLSKQNGELKNIIITKSDTTQNLLIRFILRSKESVDRLRKVGDELQSMLPEVKVVSANIQPKHAAILEGEEEIVLSKNDTIIHHYDNIKLHLGVKSFFQVTSEVARELYSTVADFLKDKKINSMLDLYCGVGAFSFYAAQSVNSVTGVEISSEAIRCAMLSKQDNQVTNAHFKALDVDHLWDELTGDFDCILVNPPRRGVGLSSMQKIKNLAPQYLIYSSCNVETLYSDFTHIQDKYEVIFSRIFDMFPFSKHFEVLMIFKKR